MKINKSIIYIILSAGLLLYVFSLYQRTPHLDDAWIGEQVYWLENSGIVKNVLMKNYSNDQDQLLIYHKAHVYSGLLGVKIFGFSLLTLKLTTYFYFILFFVVFFFYMVKNKHIVNNKQYLILILLFLFETHIFEFSFVFRPEIPLMCAGFLSFIFLEKVIESKEMLWLKLIIASSFTGIGILFHLNGLIFIAASTFVLIFYRKYWEFLFI